MKWQDMECEFPAGKLCLSFKKGIMAIFQSLMEIICLRKWGCREHLLFAIGWHHVIPLQ